MTDDFSCSQAQSDDDDVADDVSVNVGAPDDFMTEFFAEVSDQLIRCEGNFISGAVQSPTIGESGLNRYRWGIASNEDHARFFPRFSSRGRIQARYKRNVTTLNKLAPSIL